MKPNTIARQGDDAGEYLETDRSDAASAPETVSFPRDLTFLKQKR